MLARRKTLAASSSKELQSDRILELLNAPSELVIHTVEFGKSSSLIPPKKEKIKWGDMVDDTTTISEMEVDLLGDSRTAANGPTPTSFADMVTGSLEAAAVSKEEELAPKDGKFKTRYSESFIRQAISDYYEVTGVDDEKKAMPYAEYKMPFPTVVVEMTNLLDRALIFYFMNSMPRLFDFRS